MVTITGKVNAPAGLDVYAVDYQNNAQGRRLVEVPYRQDKLPGGVLSGGQSWVLTRFFGQVGPITLTGQVPAFDCGGPDRE